MRRHIKVLQCVVASTSFSEIQCELRRNVVFYFLLAWVLSNRIGDFFVLKDICVKQRCFDNPVTGKHFKKILIHIDL